MSFAVYLWVIFIASLAGYTLSLALKHQQQSTMSIDYHAPAQSYDESLCTLHIHIVESSGITLEGGDSCLL
jgi:hypothetical protein